MRSEIQYTYSKLYTQRIRNIVHDNDFKEQNRTIPTAFTRKRKLPFERALGLLLNKPQHALPARINYCFEELGDEAPISWPKPSSFSQARKKVDPKVFEQLLNYSNEFFYFNLQSQRYLRKWNGKLLAAIDGSRIDIPENKQTLKIFSLMKSKRLPQGVLQGTASLLYDVLNHLPLHATLGPVIAEKNAVFNDHIPFMESGPLASLWNEFIYLLDRGYIDYSVLATFLSHSFLFCIRGKISQTFKALDSFLRSKNKDTIITLRVTSASHEYIKENKLPEEIKVRVVKVTLSTGVTEILYTNLFDQELYPTKCFKELYNYRWGIEGSFNVLKNLLGIEKFSSESPQNIFQDFHAHIFAYTLCEMLKKEIDEKIIAECKANRTEHQYQTGIGLQVNAIQAHIVEIVCKNNINIDELFLKLIKWVRCQLSPIRSNRSYERKQRSDSQRLVHSFTKKRQHS